MWGWSDNDTGCSVWGLLLYFVASKEWQKMWPVSKRYERQRTSESAHWNALLWILLHEVGYIMISYGVTYGPRDYCSNHPCSKLCPLFIVDNVNGWPVSLEYGGAGSWLVGVCVARQPRRHVKTVTCGDERWTGWGRAARDADHRHDVDGDGDDDGDDCVVTDHLNVASMFTHVSFTSHTHT